ncbi:UPF0481 protein At3g47200-like [Magnolia sinica]|uniref:UPF0481 protein At3g47200-like n=1 Tax=Magnolia sinica TaxID=86752 RepID=UPI002658D7DD|nr:UPF0481 protein At3g47200-like [Magnolia sinica]XP_058114839.1 UPF0481 protein At3g47200-like [Magnolia sinica]XP_058114847.1 UPF0481 protein At3g47200-like [Magnolia sinica]
MALDPTWVSSLKEKIQTNRQILKESAGSISCSIYRVPHGFRKANEEAYTPQIVSVGPFHHGKQMLKAMEEHKYRYLHEVISRAGDNGLEIYLMAIKELEQLARECYSETINLNSTEFVEMMVVDGCFILELLRKGVSLSDITNDPIFTLLWLKPKLKSDLLLLENQIPFFVLERLFDLMDFSLQPSVSLRSIILDFFEGMLPRGPISLKENLNSNTKTNHEIQHLLHLFHSSHLPDIPGTVIPHEQLQLTCAIKLQQAGVMFKASNANSFLDIKFRKGVLRIPPLFIGDLFNPLLLNLIAFEQCYSHCSNHVTAYTTFMNYLINSAEDVEILCHNKIIYNGLGSDAEVADLFSKLGRDVVCNPNDFYLFDVFEGLDLYYRTPWHAWRANLMHSYFSNPWAIISLIGVVILLILTFIQTFFAAFSYFRPPS